jgi:EAL domain-containing protein (putative c-di-GMP-specific phosphodiesterase class I)
MPHYHKSSTSLPLRDAGLVEFSAEDSETRSLLRDAIADFEDGEDAPITLRYDSQEQLLRFLSKLQNRLKSKEDIHVQCRICYDHEQESELFPEEEPSSTDGWFALSELFGEVSGRSISEYILHRMFTTHLQPVVQPNGTIVGYEFLMRPLPEQMPFRPAELFETARKTGQHSFLDREARHSAIRLSASHLQAGTKRFINFLPSSLHKPDTCLKGTFELMKETGTDPRDYVFEVMETESLDDPRLAKVFDVYRQEGVSLALDDVGSGSATLDTVDRLQPDYVKMDRRWVSHCDSDNGKQKYIEELLERVSRFHGVVLAEGVERAEEWEYLRKAGVPLFQGFLFGRASPVPSAVPVAAL